MGDEKSQLVLPTWSNNFPANSACPLQCRCHRYHNSLEQNNLDTAQWKASRPLSSFERKSAGFSLTRFSSATMSPSRAQSWMVRFLSPPPSPIMVLLWSATMMMVLTFEGNGMFSADYIFSFLFTSGHNILRKSMIDTGKRKAHCFQGQMCWQVYFFLGGGQWFCLTSGNIS